jgi:YHS domain-containing protein
MYKFALLPVLLFASLAFAVAQAKMLVNVDKHGIALKGHDPVAYFTQGKPVKGFADFVSEFGGAKYRFSSEENKKLFDADPAKYAPQFGGYCGYAVSKGYTAEIDPEAFIIMDGRLILQYSKSVLKTWEKDAQGYLSRADANWLKVVESEGK